MSKKSLTILCMSDMHLERGTYGDKSLELFRKKIGSYITSSPEWKPDFIAVAGDLVIGKKKSQERYSDPGTRLNTLCETFGLNKNAVIVVPGNHDKQVPEECRCCKELESDSCLHYFSMPLLDKKAAGHFTKNFSHFEWFANFYKAYVEPLDDPSSGYKYFYDEQVFSPDNDTKGLKYTSGLKVFESEKICFLCINSEWTYYPGEEKNGKKVRICAPLVQHSLNKILFEYADYLVVTLIHRNPAGFSWEERNEVSCDIVQKIYRYSDIILTGHDHHYSLLPPDMMANSAQLFSLGSMSRSDYMNELVPYNAALLRIDPCSREVMVKKCTRKYGIDEGWVIEDGGKYPLRSIYPPIKKINLFYEKELFVSSADSNRIESSIRAAMKGEWSLLVISVSHFQLSKVVNDIKESLSRNALTHLVIYYIDILMEDKAKDYRQLILNTFSSEIYSICLVVSLVLIRAPLLDIDKEGYLPR